MLVLITEMAEADLLSGLEWRLIGPFRGGRVVAVAGDPTRATVFYFGSHRRRCLEDH